MSKMQKISHNLAKYLNASERSYLVFTENSMIVPFSATISKTSALENSGILVLLC